MTTTEKKMLKAEALINVSIEKVWAFWTSPEHIINWNNASPDWHTPTAKNDLRVGGKFLSRMEAKDGSFGFDFWGEYTTIETNKCIEYTMGDGRKAQILFESNGTTTQLNEFFEPETENSHELQQSGWQAILNNFKMYAERIA